MAGTTSVVPPGQQRSMVHRLGHLMMAIMWAAAGVFLLPLFSGKGGGGVAAASVSQPLKIVYTKTRTALTMTTYSYVVHPAISAPAMPLKPVLEDAGKILVGAGGVQDQLLCRNNTLGAGEVAARCLLLCLAGSETTRARQRGAFDLPARMKACKRYACVVHVRICKAWI